MLRDLMSVFAALPPVVDILLVNLLIASQESEYTKPLYLRFAHRLNSRKIFLRY